MNNQLKLEKVIEESFNLLDNVLDEVDRLGGVSGHNAVFVYRHGRCIHRLGLDTIHLLTEGRTASCPIILRAMLESLFKLVAAVKKPDGAVEILVSEAEEELMRIKKWLDPADCGPAIKGYSGFALELRKQYGISSKKKWSTLACAEAAELDAEYRAAYFCFSAHAHAATGGLILQEKEAINGYVLEKLLFIVICAAGHTPLVLPTKTPQEHVDEATRLIEQLNELTIDGFFSEMNRLIKIDQQVQPDAR